MPGRSRAGPETVFKWRKERIRKRRSVMHPKNKSDAQIANWLLFRPLMLGLSFLFFHRLKFFVCSVALGLPCEWMRDTIDGFSYRQKFLKKIARNYCTTIQNKSLIISEGCQGNSRPQNIFKSHGYTWMIHHNGNFSNSNGIRYKMAD